jgi:UDP-N-acetylmuramyl pentapeptide phosphotransferase/UDP-N-acetylglucosamine-1-phosphate transferase
VIVPVTVGDTVPSAYRVVALLAPLWLVGAVDDSRGVSAGVRYVIQLTVATLAVSWFGSFAGLDAILKGFAPSWLSSVLTIVAITALINFYNFMDGLDGILGGTCAVQFAFFALYLHQPIWWLLVAALLGFLRWNWPPAKVFMGDSGSTVLGCATAIALLQAPDPASMWRAGAVTAPIVGDAAFTLLRRLLKRENIFRAHKTHVYQRLHQAGWSHGRVSGSYIALTVGIALVIGVVGVLGVGR